MKLVYCICSIYNPGGMERVMLNKIAYLVKQGGYDITIVTTDQKERAPFIFYHKGLNILIWRLIIRTIMAKEYLRSLSAISGKEETIKRNCPHFC